MRLIRHYSSVRIVPTCLMISLARAPLPRHGGWNARVPSPASPSNQQRGTMWVTRSAQIQRTTPVSTSATWNSVGTFGSLAPPSTWITSAIHQSSESVLPQITVMPAFTDRNTGVSSPRGLWNGTTEWSTDIPLQTSTAVLALLVEGCRHCQHFLQITKSSRALHCGKQPLLRCSPRLLD